MASELKVAGQTVARELKLLCGWGSEVNHHFQGGVNLNERLTHTVLGLKIAKEHQEI